MECYQNEPISFSTNILVIPNQYNFSVIGHASHALPKTLTAKPYVMVTDINFASLYWCVSLLAFWLT